MIGELWSFVVGLLDTKRRRRKPLAPRAGETSLRGERLERRDLLSANQIVYQPGISAIVIEGTAGADSVSVWSDASSLVHVSMENASGVQEAVFAQVTVAQVRFLGRDGNDYFQNTSTLPSLGLGEGGDDVLVGGEGGSFFQGGTGNDQLIGGSGVDQLYGDDGNDSLHGGGGDDVLVGGLGADSLFGGEGDDDIYGQDGDDVIQAGNGNDFISAGADDDDIHGGGGNDTVFAGDGHDRLYGDDGDDLLTGEAGNDAIDGGIGNDVLFGSAGNDTLVGGEGDDDLYGEDGVDLLSGGAGSDYLNGGLMNDALFGGADGDTLVGEDGDDRLYGEDGADWLNGGNGNDVLQGGLADDVLFGNAGNDTLTGEDGDDDLYGHDGDDLLTGGNGVDYLNGGLNNDVLFGGIDNDTLIGEDGDDRLYGEDGDDSLAGTAGNDLLEGGFGNDGLTGGTGNDRLVGDEGDDRLYGDEGVDLLAGSAGNDYLNGGLQNDALFGGTGNDTLAGDEGDDNLYGEDGQDWLTGGAGNDVLQGGFGNDNLFAGAGNDTLFGEDGDDDLYGEDGVDFLNGGNGIDYLNGGLQNDSLFGGADDDTLSGGEGDDRLYGEDGNDSLTGGQGNDVLQGGLGNDTLFAGSDNDTLAGEGGNDSLYGEDGADWINGGAGNDYLNGGLANDTLFGGDGDDTLAGEDGDDRLAGDDGVDNLTGGAGNDTIDGGRGNDKLYGGTGNDALVGGDGDDYLYGEDGLDALAGGAGADALFGGFGNDLLSGGLDNDTLNGEDGDDVLFGDEGNDYLLGQSGNDAVVGGAGQDQLLAGFGSDVLIGGRDQDQMWGEEDSDLLIGGTTEFDQDETALRALVFAWSAALPYATRVEQIRDELFATHLENEETVFDDGVADSLYGGAQQDWLFQTGYLGIYRPSDVEPYNGSVEPGTHSHSQIIVPNLPALEGFAFIDSLDKLTDRQTDETLDTLIPHSDNATLQREHLALFEQVRYNRVTTYAVASGNWSDSETWSNGIVPTAGARVLIPIGVHVEVDGVIAARLATVRVDGTLSFNTTRTTELRVDTMVVTGSGAFEMGTATNPIAPTATARLWITDNGPIDRTSDPFGIGRGLISHGRVSIYGSEVSSYIALATPPASGTQTLVLKTIPIGWKVGDSVVIASTVEDVKQNEVRRILGIAGNVVQLDQALTYNHLSPATNLEVHVANVTRNAIIESESTVIDRHGHVMFMHARDVHIENAGFYRLGRTDKSKPVNDPVVTSGWQLTPGTGTNPRGRYSVHFHRNGTTNDGRPATITGSAVVDSPGWGFVNHTSYVDMINNVAFDVHGAAFATEVGNEIGGFYGNLALGTQGTGAVEAANAREAVQDFGFQGDGFWFQGAGISVVGNISAGNQESAFVYYTRGLIEGGVRQTFPAANLANPSLAQGASSIDIGLVPVRQFTNNVGYSSHFGVQLRYHLQNATNGGHSYVTDSTFWNNDVGVYLPYTENTTIRNVKVINGMQPQPHAGVTGNIATRNNTYENLTVSGYFIGIEPARQGTTIISGGTFNNVHDILIYTAAMQARTILITAVPDQTKVTTVFETSGWGPPATTFFVKDRILLNFGPYIYRQLYFVMQQADAVPFPASRPDLPAQYVGLTNQELWDQYGVALGGGIAPADAVTAPSIIGLISPT